MNKTLAILLLLASPACAEVRSIDSNVKSLPITNSRYIVVALPQNYATDANCTSLIKGFKTPPEKTTVYWYWPQNENWKDWEHRFQKRIPDSELPVVLAMDGAKVTFKRSHANYDEIAGSVQGVGGRRILNILFPNCPGPNCPVQPDDPYSPDPDSPLQPIPDTPTVPDTPIPDTPVGPIGPDPALLAVIAELERRIEVLEARTPEKGDDGKDGTNGKDGAPGVSPTLDYATIVAEVQKRLTHSIEVTLLSGKVQKQTKPLDQPLELNQRTVSAKP